MFTYHQHRRFAVTRSVTSTITAQAEEDEGELGTAVTPALWL